MDQKTESYYEQSHNNTDESQMNIEKVTQCFCCKLNHVTSISSNDSFLYPGE